MPELSLVQLRHFCSVAEVGSIAEAARQNHVSATAVGSAISNLEQTLQTELCSRERSRGVTLTPNGHHFYREALRLVRSADDLLRIFPDSTDEYAHPLRIGAFHSLAPFVLPGLLEAFETEHPEVSCEFVTGTVLELVELMLTGEIHCFFSYNVFHRTNSLPAGLATETLYPTELQVLLAANHPLADRETLSANDLIDEPLVLFESNPSKRYSMPALGQLSPQAKIRYRTSDFELNRSMVARGMGYSLIMNPIPAGQSYEGLPLAKVRLDPPLAGTSMVVVRPEGRWQHPSTRSIIDLSHRLVTDGGLGSMI